MGAKRKTVLKGFDYMHCDDFARFLNEMAAKGWHFKEWGVGLKFEKGEPENAIYAVEVFTKATENDMRPELNTQEFAEYCEAAGWKFIDAKQKFCVFKKMNDDAVELFSPTERVLNAWKGMLSGNSVVLLVLYAFNVILQWINLNISFERNIFSAIFFFNFLLWNVMLFERLFLFGFTFWKKRQLEKKIQTGEDIYIGNRIDEKYHLNWNDAYVIVLTLLLMYYLFVTNRMGLILMNVIIIGLTVGLAVLVNKIRPERETNVMIQTGFSIAMVMVLLVFTAVIIADKGEDVSAKQEKLPLLITDYRECEDVIDDVDFYHERNVLGSMDVYYIFGEENSIFYHVYESKHAKILDRIWEEVFRGKKYNEDAIDCTDDWEAIEAVRNAAGTYFVRYEDKILIFSDDVDVYLNTDHIHIIRDKLDLR